MPLTRSMPRMYHRRLAMIAAAMIIAFLGLGTQLAWLSIARGSTLRATAERALQSRMILPTIRGSILDRHGRVLAESVAIYAVAIHYTLFDEGSAEDMTIEDVPSWVTDNARRQAYQELGPRSWQRMSTDERNAAAAKREPFWIDRRERAFAEVRRAGQLTQEELWERLRRVRRSVARIEENTPDCREKVIAHRVLDEVDDDTALALRRIAREIRDLHPLPPDFEMTDPFEVVDDRKRRQPWLETVVELPRDTLPSPLRLDEPVHIRLEDVAAGVIGQVRPVYDIDVAARPFRDREGGVVDLGGYAPGDVVGSSGVEAAMEDALRGRRGTVVRQLDSRGQRRDAPVSGADVQLTIDYELQALVEGILAPEFGLARVDERWQSPSPFADGRALDAAAVVIEVASGEILALARSVNPRPEGEVSSLCDPAQSRYPPGSIVKPLVLVAAMSDGELSPGEEIECRGHYFDNVFESSRCWIYRENFQYRTHGPLGPAEAIGRSCNIYFYTLAERLGHERLTTWFGRFGADRALDVGLAHERTISSSDGTGTRTVRHGEAPGFLPPPDSSDRGLLVSLGIGQRWLWTPLHAANAYAILARRGEIDGPTLVRHPEPPPNEAPDLPLDTTAVRIALTGLRMSVSESFGTGNHISIGDGTIREEIFAGLEDAGIRVWGKTGTAQAPDIMISGVEEKVDHAWFVGLVGRAAADDPEFAIAVLVEYGGSGGRVAGPVAHQIFRAMMRLGYLPDVVEGGGG